MKWSAVEIICQANAAEAAQYGLLEAGALGTTEESKPASDDSTVTGYFDGAPDLENIRAQLQAALTIYSLPADAARKIESHEVAARDWLAEWKAGWQPVAVGARFLIAPPWSDTSDAPDERIIIRIEPGMAFGTGTHETTRLCLAAIERYYAGGSFLDVGTGTGILAIAAAKMYPDAQTQACDTDAEAVAIARDNARANDVGALINFRVGSVDETTSSAACVCANLTADVIVPLLPTLINLSCERTILSGILASQTAMVRAAMNKLGIGKYEVIADGEWVAMIV